MISVEQFLAGETLSYATTQGHPVTATYMFNADLGLHSVKVCPAGQRRALSNVAMSEMRRRWRSNPAWPRDHEI